MKNLFGTIIFFVLCLKLLAQIIDPTKEASEWYGKTPQEMLGKDLYDYHDTLSMTKINDLTLDSLICWWDDYKQECYADSTYNFYYVIYLMDGEELAIIKTKNKNDYPIEFYKGERIPIWEHKQPEVNEFFDKFLKNKLKIQKVLYK